MDMGPAGLPFNPQGYSIDGTAVFATDQQLLVKFFSHPQISKFQSDKAGVPVYEDIEMISVIQPGEKEEIKVLATEFHRRRFPKQYENFKKGIENVAGGTPLDHLFPSEPSTILTLKQFHIFTIQQLANITDSAMTQLPFGRSLVDRARAYISSASNGKNFQAMQTEMQRQIDELKAMLGDKSATLPTPAPLNLQYETTVSAPVSSILPADQAPRKRGRKFGCLFVDLEGQ